TGFDAATGQYLEVPIDQAGTYVIQDPGLIAGTQLQLSNVIQGGKSLLKPELAQHLTQSGGYKVNNVYSSIL
ncbi:unnamed protein product, partial [Protopolystoma xenopodis]